MVGAIAEKIFAFVLCNTPQANIGNTQKQVYQYGIELIVATVINFICIIVTGAILGRAAESIVFLIAFSTLRQFTGGYHADTYLKCNSIFILSFLCVLFLSLITVEIISVGIAAIVLAVSFPLIMSRCPVEHPNKPINKQLNSKCKLISSVLWVGIGVTTIVMIALNTFYGVLLFYTLLLVEALIVVVIIKDRRGIGC